MKKLYLSHSQLSTFKDCERKWFLQKIERLRPTFTGSALIFGSALDSAVESILLDMMLPEKERKNLDPKEVFLKQLDNFQVNGKDKKLPEDLLAVKFFASNVDEKLLKTIDLAPDFERIGIEPIEVAPFLEYCKTQRKAKVELEDTEQMLFNTLAYRTIQTSGLMFIDALIEWIEENVAEVHSVQKKIEIDDGNGNKFVGYLDFIVTLKDGRKLLIDLKSSSNPKLYYPEDSASKSPQLGIYAQEEGLFNVAYLVIDKNVRVRDPRIRLHFIEGEITEDFLDEVFEEITDCVDKIYEKMEYGKEAFEMNKDSCNNYGSCEYRDYCWKGSKKNLEKV